MKWYIKLISPFFKTYMGVDYETYPAGFRNGRCVVRRNVTEPSGFCHQSDCSQEICAYSTCCKDETIARTKWESEAAPVFVENRQYLREKISLIPNFVSEEIIREME